MRRGLLVVTGILATLTMIDWTGLSTNSKHEQSDRFWSIPYLASMEANSFSSLDEMVDFSDLAVLARVTSVKAGRSFRASDDDSEVSFAWYADVELTVERTLRGDPRRVTSMEVFFPTERRFKEFLAALLPEESAIFLLENKEGAALRAGWAADLARAERPYNMLVSPSSSYMRNIEGRVHLANPEDGSLGAWEGRDFEELLVKIDSIS